MGSGGGGAENAKFGIPGVCSADVTVKTTRLSLGMCLDEFLKVENPR